MVAAKIPTLRTENVEFNTNKGTSFFCSNVWQSNPNDICVSFLRYLALKCLHPTQGSSGEWNSDLHFSKHICKTADLTASRFLFDRALLQVFQCESCWILEISFFKVFIYRNFRWKLQRWLHRNHKELIKLLTLLFTTKTAFFMFT